MDTMVGEKARSRGENADWYPVCKRVLDVLVSAAVLVLMLPAMALIALAVVLDDPRAGPIFVQTRVGKDGTLFRLYKFRTMVPGAEKQLEQLRCRNEMDGPVFKLRRDPRITRVGRLLRRSGLDELPQLWNVLRGEMSLVGPRPGLPEEVRQYDAFARRRLMVQPGITCYWQVMPERNNLSFEQWMALDNDYLRDMDLWTDWKILLETVKAVFRMDGQ